MKTHEPESWIEVRRMPPGRRQWAFTHVLARLPESAPDLRALCEQGIAAESELLSYLLRFKGDQGTKDPSKVWPRAVVDLDAVLDRRIGHLQDFLRTMTAIFDGKPRGDTWQRLLQATFPAGATYYTAQPYVEQAARVKTLLNELASPAWAELTGESVVAETIGALADAHGVYASAVSRFEQLDKVSWDHVKGLDLADHRRLCVLVAGVVSAFANDEATRGRLLAPIAQQDQEVYEALRARRKVLDVDPSTGEPLAPVVPASDEPQPV